MKRLRNRLYNLSIALLVIFGRSIQVNADKYDDLFDSIFHFGTHEMSVEEIREALNILYTRIQESSDASTSIGIYSTDPRKVEISFWKNADEINMSKCNQQDFRILEAQFQRSISISEKSRSSSDPSVPDATVLNLKTYYKEVLGKWVSFCSRQMPIFYEDLQRSTENQFTDILDLSDGVWHTARLSPYEIGRRVGNFILKKAEDDIIMQLGVSLDDLALFKQVYDHYTPCTSILNAVQRHQEFYDLLTNTRHFRLKEYRFPTSRMTDGEDNMQNWINRITVCLFIEESPEVLELAVDTMVQRERMVLAIYEATHSRDRGVFNNERFNWIFRYSPTPMTFIQVKSTLAILNFRKTGLRQHDYRRNAVCFWLNAASHHVSRCNDEDDQILRLNLEYDKARANEAELTEQPFQRGSFLNLETFVQEVRWQRLQYCEFSIGLIFVSRIEKWRNANRKGCDLRALTEGLFHLEPMNPNVVGKRVADLIIRKSHNGSLARLQQSLLDTGWIMKQYDRHTPCHGLMTIVDRYRSFYGLATAPGLYEHTRPSLRHWIDKISVCAFIEQHAEQVFNAAALYLGGQA